MLPDQSSEEKSTCLIDYNSLTTYPISTKKRKRLSSKRKQKRNQRPRRSNKNPKEKSKCKSWRKERSLTLTPFWTDSHSNGIPYRLVLLKHLQHLLGIHHHRPKGAQRSCTLVLCIRTILYKGKRPTLSTAIGSTTNALSEIVMSAVVWTM